MDIINNLNVLLESIFTIIETEVYEVIDKIVVVNLDIFKMDIVSEIIDSKIIIYIANSLILMYVCYFIFSKLTSMYSGVKSENLYLFIVKLVILFIVINNSYFILENIIDINGILTETIEEGFKNIIKEDITFNNLKVKLLDVDDVLNLNNISLNGILKTIISFSLTSILITLAIRYVMIILYIILFPLILAIYPSNLTRELSLNILKMFIISLFTQNIIKIILVIPLILKNDNELYQVILLGSMYILQNLNNIVKEMFSKISVYQNKRSLYEM